MKRNITVALTAIMLCVISSCASSRPSECMQAYREEQFQKAIQLCEQLGNSGNGEGYHVLGFIYDVPFDNTADPKPKEKELIKREKQNVIINKNLSLNYFKKAFEMGYVGSGSVLVALSVQKKDYESAAHYRRLIAERYHYWSEMQGLAYQYVKGQGVPKDLVQAYKWYYLGFYGNDVPSKNTCKKREEIVPQMTLAEVEEAIRQAKETAKSWGRSGKDKCEGLEIAFDCEPNNEPEQCREVRPNVISCIVPPKVKNCKYRPYKLMPDA